MLPNIKLVISASQLVWFNSFDFNKAVFEQWSDLRILATVSKVRSKNIAEFPGGLNPGVKKLIQANDVRNWSILSGFMSNQSKNILAWLFFGFGMWILETLYVECEDLWYSSYLWSGDLTDFQHRLQGSRQKRFIDREFSRWGTGCFQFQKESRVAFQIS